MCVCEYKSIYNTYKIHVYYSYYHVIITKLSKYALNMH